MLMRLRFVTNALFMGLFLIIAPPVTAANQAPLKEAPIKFAVLNQHSVLVTAQIWNPILVEVSRISGIPLTLAMAKTAPETTAKTVAGDYDFAYTNHLFTPERDQLGWRVIARINRPGIASLIVTDTASNLRTLTDLEGKTVAFPSKEAFVGYHIPNQALTDAGITVEKRFAGNQEGAMQQLMTGAVAAAAVNDKVMQAFSHRKGFDIKVLWQSQTYPDLAVMASPKLEKQVVQKVQQALINLHHDPAGLVALQKANRIIHNSKSLAFLPANNQDYSVYRQFWQHYNQEKP